MLHLLDPDWNLMLHYRDAQWVVWIRSLKSSIPFRYMGHNFPFTACVKKDETTKRFETLLMSLTILSNNEIALDENFWVALWPGYT